MTPKGRTSNGDRGGQATNAGRRAVITGSLWSYWQVYVGLSLAVLLVSAGLTLAIQNLGRTQPSEKIAADSEGEISIQNGPIQEPKTNPLTSDLSIEVAVAKPVPAFPFQAAKIARAPETPLSEPQPAANLEPAKEEIQIVEARPEPAAPAPKPPAAEDKRDPTCGTAIHFVHSPTVANRDALKEDKLVFILHVSGNFEDSQFT